MDAITGIARSLAAAPGIRESAPVQASEARPAETCTANTDKVDRELEQLRGRRDELARQLEAQTDPSKARDLEKSWLGPRPS